MTTWSLFSWPLRVRTITSITTTIVALQTFQSSSYHWDIFWRQCQQHGVWISHEFGVRWLSTSWNTGSHVAGCHFWYVRHSLCKRSMVTIVRQIENEILRIYISSSYRDALLNLIPYWCTGLLSLVLRLEVLNEGLSVHTSFSPPQAENQLSP